LLFMRAVDEELALEATGRNNLDFAVHYLQNDLFPENPVPSNLAFLQHFVDFIEIDSSFSADFSVALDVSYSYTALKRFVITYGGSGNPVVYEREIPLSQERGRVTTDSLELDGGKYIIRLGDFTSVLDEFLYESELIFDGSSEAGAPAPPRNFSAVLEISFTYSVATLPTHMHQSTTRGYHLPIGQNVFTLEPFGSAGFTETVVHSPDQADIMLSQLVLPVVLVLAGAGTVVFSVFRQDEKEDPARKRVKGIIKKYATEIVVTDTSPNLEAYQVMLVVDFDEILKLSINLNKHITCYENNEMTLFCVIVDSSAYCYEVHYNILPQQQMDDVKEGNEVSDEN